MNHSIVLLDTTVYLNVLDVPGFNQDRNAVLDEFAQRVEHGDHFLLPMATIWETGNHIADLHDGNWRRQFAQKFVDDVYNAFEGIAPYRPTYFPDRQVFLTWLADFPDYAQRSKSSRQTREGVSLSNFSVIKEWERIRALHSMSSVLIWSLDPALSAYDTGNR